MRRQVGAVRTVRRLIAPSARCGAADHILPDHPRDVRLEVRVLKQTNPVGSATPSPRILLSLENAVCTDSYRRQVLCSLPIDVCKILPDSVL